MGISFNQKDTAQLKTSKESIFNKEITLFSSGFSNKKKEYFYRELSILLKSGVSLKAALEIILDSQERKKDREFYSQIIKGVVSGQLLSEVLEDNPSFKPYEKHALKIADKTGQKETITEDLYQYYLNKNKQRRQIVGSLPYPVIVLLTALGVTFFMLKFVVPTFQDTFRQNNVELPGITKAIIGFSDFINDNGWLLLMLFGLTVVGFWRLKKTPSYKRVMGNALVKLPILGRFIKRNYIVQFTHAMALLTKAKVPITTALALVKDMIDFYPLKSSLTTIEAQIVQGGSLHQSFGESAFFEKKMVALLKVAEETNQTEYIFTKLYEQYRDDLVYQSGLLTNILNPLLTIFVGLIVGLILLAMYLPMFKLSSLIG